MASTRRNGQLSSCEPCRKSKLRCDHMSPFCGRCYRRGLQDQCIYHPAPLTRPDLRQPSRKRQEKANTYQPLNTSFNAENENWTQKKASVSTPGFLGHTSYSDAFTDTTRSGGSLNTQRERCEMELISDGSTPDFEGVAFVDSKKVQLGAQVLVLLKDLPFYRKVVTARLKIWEGWCLGWPVTEMLFDTVEKMWYSVEVETEDPKLRALTLSRRIFQTYTRLFDVNKTLSWSEFTSTTSGRWETVGLVFCLTGLATEWLSKEDPLFKQPGSLDPESLATTASTVCDICLQLCDSVGIINDIVTWLLLHHTILLAVVYGEGDYRPWRKLGELSTAVFALGLHQDSSSRVPFFLSELRKRTMVATFTMDKVLATFLGRPPLISWRYCDIQLPLDLTSDDLFTAPEVHQAAIAELNRNHGWNPKGILTQGAWARVTLLKSILREKVLELSLSYRTENLQQKVEGLSRENQRTRLELPDFLHWVPENGSLIVSLVEDRLLFSLHLDFLYNDFLLGRIIQKHTHAQPESLLTISRDILNALLSMLAKTARSGHPVFEHGWHLCYYGLPAAGLLSTELLRRSHSAVTDIYIHFPRSEVIQNLSIFASHLDTIIQRHEGNYQVAQQGQRVIRHILDQVLSFHDMPSLSKEVPNGQNENSTVKDLLFDVDMDDRELFLDWLDGSVEQPPDSWMRWVDFN